MLYNGKIFRPYSIRSEYYQLKRDKICNRQSGCYGQFVELSRLLGIEADVKQVSDQKF